MSRYILIRRLRGPAILLLIGVLALLHQMGVIPYFWRLFWPLLLITVGLLLLAERAALASEGYPIFPWDSWHDAGQGMNPGAQNPGAGQGAANSAANPGTAIVPSQWQEFEDDRKGGES
jgi:hypothetical protein